MDFIKDYDQDEKQAKIFDASDDSLSDTDFDFPFLSSKPDLTKQIPATTDAPEAQTVVAPSVSEFPEEEEFDDFYDEDELEAMRDNMDDFESSPQKSTNPFDKIQTRSDLDSFSLPPTNSGDSQANKRFRADPDAPSVERHAIDHLGKLVSETSIDFDAPLGSKQYAPTKSVPLQDAENIINYYDPVAYGRFVTATNAKGKTLFVPRKSESAKSFDASVQKSLMATNRQLLTGSIFQLLDKIDAEVKKPEPISSRLSTLHGRIDEDAVRKELWVEKYRPKVFLDLKGDQRLNREALEWLKQWDQCVFPSASRTNKRINALRSDEAVQHKDVYHRPEKKILLLSGPPGLGKTSLAHVLARQCGYNCIEINASDDRTASVVRDRITNAIEMKSVFGDQRPNLIVIDEIDGVSSAGGSQNFINLLIQLATSGSEVAADKDTRKKKPKILKRPIICICNDQFAPALRQLRPHCQIFAFKRLPTAYTVEHLKDICEQEGVTANSYTLTTLSELTGGDFRSSINTLQFLAESHHRTISYDMVANGQTGLKDSPKSLFAIWDSIFLLPNSNAMSCKRALDDDGQAPTKHMDHLVRTLFTHGGFNVMMEGCFENYLKAKYIDTYLEKLCAAGEWMIWHDTLDLRINAQQQNALFPYFPYPIIAFHSLFASASPRRIDFPKLDRQFRDTFRTNTNILAGFYDSLSPSLRRNFSRPCLPKYLIHLVLQIIEPDFSRLNLQILRPAEKALIAQVVNRMATLNVQYRQSRSSEGQLVYELDPPLHLLADFEAPQEAAVQFFPAARNELKQHILHETEKEVLRRKDAAWQARNLANANRTVPKSSAPIPAFWRKPAPIPASQPAPTEGGFSSSKIMFMPLVPKPLASLTDAKKQARKNPFAAFKAQPSPSQRPSQSQSQHPKKVWFVFLDGYSNAVRTPLYMRDL